MFRPRKIELRPPSSPHLVSIWKQCWQCTLYSLIFSRLRQKHRDTSPDGLRKVNIIFFEKPTQGFLHILLHKLEENWKEGARLFMWPRGRAANAQWGSQALLVWFGHCATQCKQFPRSNNASCMLDHRCWMLTSWNICVDCWHSVWLHWHLTDWLLTDGKNEATVIWLGGVLPRGGAKMLTKSYLEVATGHWTLLSHSSLCTTHQIKFRYMYWRI